MELTTTNNEKLIVSFQTNPKRSITQEQFNSLDDTTRAQVYGIIKRERPQYAYELSNKYYDVFYGELERLATRQFNG